MLTHFAKILAESLADELVTVLVVVVLHVDLSCQAWPSSMSLHAHTQ